MSDGQVELIRQPQAHTVQCVVCGVPFTFQATRFGGMRHPVFIPVDGSPAPTTCSAPCAAEVEVREADALAKEAEAEAARVEAWRTHRLGLAVRATWPRFSEARPEHLLPELAAVAPGGCAILTGPTGTGKTHQAWAWWQRWAVERDAQGERPGSIPTPMFYTAADLMEMLRRSFDGEPVRLPLGHLLVLDDLGAEKASEWTVQELNRIVDERYRQCAPLLVTSNLSGKEMRERLGDRLVSRLAEMCVPVRIEGSDRRLRRVEPGGVA